MRPRRVALLAALALLLDQVTKALAWRLLAAPLPLGPLTLRRQANTGSGFGLFPGANALLALLTAAVCAAIIYLLWRQPRSRAAAGLALVLGGALGNLGDRVVLGYVRDFLDLGFWPVFNLADAAVTVGAALLLLALRPRRGEIA